MLLIVIILPLDVVEARSGFGRGCPVPLLFSSSPFPNSSTAVPEMVLVPARSLGELVQLDTGIKITWRKKKGNNFGFLRSQTNAKADSKQKRRAWKQKTGNKCLIG